MVYEVTWTSLPRSVNDRTVPVDGTALRPDSLATTHLPGVLTRRITSAVPNARLIATGFAASRTTAASVHPHLLITVPFTQLEDYKEQAGVFRAKLVQGAGVHSRTLIAPGVVRRGVGLRSDAVVLHEQYVEFADWCLPLSKTAIGIQVEPKTVVLYQDGSTETWEMDDDLIAIHPLQARYHYLYRSTPSS